ncbi:MAG: type II toxin-antitoxin system prevent-host-death family antitoxin [Boseongicola sp.]|nr:type II toxin-antitoxin system prevent-host-death family antitoxin [Boseongicola sp.]
MQPMPELKARDFTRHRSDPFDAAIRSPVAITRHRKPKFVLMSTGQCQQLARGGTRQVRLLDEMTDARKTLMIEGLERDLQPNVD